MFVLFSYKVKDKGQTFFVLLEIKETNISGKFHLSNQSIESADILIKETTVRLLELVSLDVDI